LVSITYPWAPNQGEIDYSIISSIERFPPALAVAADEVDISLTESENTNIFELRLGDGDVGKVIGKKGKNVMALRTILSAATAKAGGKRSMLEIIE
jgi:hypothetical protein